MKRTLTIKTGNDGVRVVVKATITTRKLDRLEVETLVDDVATNVMKSLEHVAYAQTPLSKMVLQ